MKVIPKNSHAVAKKVVEETGKAIAQSSLFIFKKFGLYRYQAFRVDPETGMEVSVGPENVYGVVASDLVDLVFNEMSGG